MSSSTSKTTFLVPDFDSKVPNKVGENVHIESPHILTMKQARVWHPAVAITGFLSEADGVYVYVSKTTSTEWLMIGFSRVKTIVPENSAFPSCGFPGTCFSCHHDTCWPQNEDYFGSDIAKKGEEIISILTISNNGGKKEIQWIVDGNEGRDVDCTAACTSCFNVGNKIFPSVSFKGTNQRVEFIPFDQVKSRSPVIEKLLKEYSSQPTTASAHHSKAAVASSKQKQESSAALTHLQAELEKERERANALESQLYTEKKESVPKNQRIHEHDAATAVAHLQLELEKERQRANSLEAQLQSEKKASTTKDQ